VDLQGYLRAFKWGWILVVVLAVAGAGAAAFLVSRATPTYASTVTFFATTTTNETTNSLQGAQFGEQRVNTYVKLLSTEDLANRVHDDANVNLTTRQIMKEVKGSADLNTVLVTATVTDTSPSRSLEIAYSISRVFPAMVEDLESKNGDQLAPVSLDVVSGPALKASPVSPRKKLDVAVGGLAGAAVGIALVLLIAVIRNSRAESRRRRV
jgi:capsular polysaccharide biosynthesis protein